MTDLQELDIQISVWTVGAVLTWHHPLWIRCVLGVMLACLWVLRYRTARKMRLEALAKKLSEDGEDNKQPGDTER